MNGQAHTAPRHRSTPSAAGVTTRAVANEFAKMRHLHVGLLIVVLALAVSALTILTSVVSPDFADPATRRWEQLLAGLGLAVPLTAPLLLAICASRVVDAEHQGNGWLLAQTSGVTPGTLCRAKMLGLGIGVALATTAAVFVPLVVGYVLGIDQRLQWSAWLGQLACFVVVNLVVLAGHLMLAARVENQLVGLGIGVVGTIIAVFAPSLPPLVRHLTPWGYYSLAAAADHVDGALVAIEPAYGSIALLGLVGTVALVVITARFDRQEA